jgi:23S rRNA (adenine2503-C2)-methyltransferase
MPEKTNLTGLLPDELESFLTDHGEKPFRGQQLFRWLYQKKAESFDEMTNLSKSLRQKLGQIAEIGHLKCINRQSSQETVATKYLFQLKDGYHIESVYIYEQGRHTLCISSQAGCALNCSFCATGRLGFQRNLSAGEIVDQVIHVERDLQRELTNIVFMGMGEPLNNYDNAIKAATLINHNEGLAVGARRIVISTAGIVPAIYRFTKEEQRFRLAVSLNAAIQAKREEIMPVSKRFPLVELAEAMRAYSRKMRELVTIEYVLIRGFNDQPEDIAALKQLLKGMRCKLNIIPYNETAGKYRRPSVEQVDRFYNEARDIGVPMNIRWSKGDDIDAACGQLAVKESPSTNHKEQV